MNVAKGLFRAAFPADSSIPSEDFQDIPAIGALPFLSAP